MISDHPWGKHPEEVDYRDSGCSLFPSCLSCPLERCRYDEPPQREQQRQRDKTILDLRRRGVSNMSIAAQYGLTLRSVFRVLAGAAPADNL